MSNGFDFFVDEEDVKISRSIHTASKYDIYLSEGIESVAAYREAAHIVMNTKENDVVEFHLGGYGGDCHGVIYLINAINIAPAKVNMNVMSPCYSAHSTLAISGDDLHMNPDTVLMFHNYSSYTGGKGAELTMSVEETNKWIHGYMRRIHRPFLSLKECKKIESDRDVYVRWNDKDLEDRIKRHFK